MEVLTLQYIAVHYKPQYCTYVYLRYVYIWRLVVSMGIYTVLTTEPIDGVIVCECICSVQKAAYYVRPSFIHSSYTRLNVPVMWGVFAKEAGTSSSSSSASSPVRMAKQNFNFESVEASTFTVDESLDICKALFKQS